MLHLNKILIFLIIVALTLPVQAGFESCVQGLWQLDKKRSDNPKRVMKKLRRQLKQQHDRKYYRQKPSDKSEANVASLPNNLPRFVFLDEALNITLIDSHWQLKQPSFSRNIPVDGLSNSYSLSAYSASTYTYLASVTDEQLMIDSHTGLGLRVQEQYALVDKNRLKVAVALLLEGNKPLHLERFFNRVSNDGVYNKHCLHKIRSER